MSNKPTVKLVQVDCPYRDCEKSLGAEVNADWANMKPSEQNELINSVKKRLLPGLKKHHKDGHPK